MLNLKLIAVLPPLVVAGWWFTQSAEAESPETIDTFSAYILCKGIRSEVQTNTNPLSGEESVIDLSSQFEEYYKIENGIMTGGTTDPSIIGKKIISLTDTYIDLPQADYRINRIDGSFGHASDGGLVESHYKIEKPGKYTVSVDFNIECMPVAKKL